MPSDGINSLDLWEGELKRVCLFYDKNGSKNKLGKINMDIA